MKDRFGREVKVGCVIAYPGRQSSSCWLATGRVVEIVEDRPANTSPYMPWLPKLRLEGGSRGPGSDELVRRSVRWHDGIVVLDVDAF